MKKFGRRRGDPQYVPGQNCHSSAQVRLHGAHKSSIEIVRRRLLLGAGLFTVAFFVLSMRLVEVALFNEVRPLNAVNEEVETRDGPARADITDRNGVILATSLATRSLYADPQDVRSSASAAARLAEVLPEIDLKTVMARLSSDKRFVWLKRHLTPRQVAAVNALGEPGFRFLEEQRRVYPHGSLVVHAVGYAKLDNRGLSGLERTYDKRLLSHPNKPLTLSIDLRFQHVMHEELARAILLHHPVGAVGIILDIASGGLRAIVSLPDFNPNESGSVDQDVLFNRATLGTYEMGSTFKVFTTAMALDTGVATLQDGFDASEPLRLARHVIRDFHGEARWLSVPEIFIHSSNIGAAKMTLAVGGDIQRDFLARLGLLDRSQIELPEIAAPRYPKQWKDINTATIGFGHGIAVSPVQLCAGIASLINGGFWRSPTLLVENEKLNPAERVVSRVTSRAMRQLLRLAVTHGTGQNAEVAGYRVGGKTGTAEKVGPKGYDRSRVLSSFVGVFPISAPRYLVFVMLDEPKGAPATHGYVTGGWTAAPVVGRVIARIGPMSGIAPAVEGTAKGDFSTTVVMLDGDEIRLAAY